MAQDTVQVTEGVGKNIDTFTTTTGKVRQAVVVADTDVNANVARVLSTDPVYNAAGLIVRDVNATSVVSGIAAVTTRLGQTMTVALDPGHSLGFVEGINTTVTIQTDPGYELGSVKGINSTVAVYFDQSEPTVKVITGETIAVALDPGYTLGYVEGINSTVGVYLSATAGTIGVNVGKISDTIAVYLHSTAGTVGVNVGSIADTVAVFLTGSSGTLTAYLDAGTTIEGITSSVAVYFDRGNPSVNINSQTSTLNVQLDPGHTLGSIENINTTVTVQTDPGHELGSIRGINTTVAVYFDPATPSVSATFSGTTAVYFDQSEPTVKVKTGSTVAVSLDPGHELGSIKGINSTVAVYFDPATPSVAATFSGTIATFFDQSEPTVKVKTGSTIAVALDPGYTLGYIAGIRETVAVYFDPSNPAVAATFNPAATISVDVGLTEGTVTVRLDPGYTLGNIQRINETVAVYFDPSNPAVAATFSGTTAVYFDQSEPTVKVKTGSTVAVSLDPGHELGSIKGINSTVAVYFDQSEPTVKVKTGSTVAVSLDPGYTLGYIAGTRATLAVSGGEAYEESAVVPAAPSGGTAMMERDDALGGITPSEGDWTHFRANANGALWVRHDGTIRVGDIPGTVAVYFDQSAPTVKAIPSTGTFTVQFDPGHTLGYLEDINSTVDVKIASGYTVFTNAAHTAGIFTVAGSVSGSYPSGYTLVAPSANYSFKVFAYSIQTTGAVSTLARFTTGGAASPVDLWRALATASGVTGVQGANLAVPPPGYLFATGTSTTLALLFDSGSLVHYSVSFIKESA